MITILVIVILLFAWKYYKKHKDTAKEKIKTTQTSVKEYLKAKPEEVDPKEREAALANMPNLYFKAKEYTKTEKALNLWESESNVLDSLSYNCETRKVKLTMVDKTVYERHIDDLQVKFERTKGILAYYIGQGAISHFGSGDISFCRNGLFSKEEWAQIGELLLLAGKTYGRDDILKEARDKKIENGLKFVKGAMKAAEFLG